MAGTTSAPRTASARRHGRQVAGLLRALARSDKLLVIPARAVEELPWLDRLDAEHLSRFLDEYATAYQVALDTRNWQSLDDFLGEWKATAEALNDPELRRLLQAEELDTSERVPLDYPE